MGTPLEDRLEHWDPFTQIDLNRSLIVDVDAVRDACRLGPDSTLAVRIGWYSSTTRLSGGPSSTELADLAGLLRVQLAQCLPGSRIGGRVDLHTRLILRHPGRTVTLISPRQPGTVLWRDQRSVAVEGSGARFPVAAVDFSQTPFPTGAAWALDWDADDLTRPLLGSLRLLVNSQHPRLLESLCAGGADPRAAMLQSFMTFDIARAMVRGGLSNPAFLIAPHSYEEGSVGRMISDLIEICWAGVPVSSLAMWMKDSPARLDTQLQAHLGTLA